MNRNECLELIMQYFQIESYIKHLKSPDLKLKSHTFFYRDTFKDIDELRILRVSSKNKDDNIVFDVYYVSQEFDGLFHGYFRIKPESPIAERLFQNISKVTTDLGHYFYYVYKQSEILKIYLISGNLQNAIEHCKDKNYKELFEHIKKATYIEIANHSVKDLSNILLRREFLEKYIANFIDLNGKSSESVKMFLINILSKKYVDHVCLIWDDTAIKNCIQVTTSQVLFHGNPDIPIYGLFDYVLSNHFVLFLKLEFDFEGGGYIGKVIG